LHHRFHAGPADVPGPRITLTRSWAGTRSSISSRSSPIAWGSTQGGRRSTISVAVANIGRGGEVRHIGTIENTPTTIGKLVRSLARRHGVVEFVCEAGSCGYNVRRPLAAMGLTCRVCAPSLTPRKPGARIKNDRHDRPRTASPCGRADLHLGARRVTRGAARPCPGAALCLPGPIGSSCIRPSRSRSRLTSTRSSTTRPGKIEVEAQIRDLLAGSPWAKQMQALQALKGVGPVVATILAEVGDLSRFAHQWSLPPLSPASCLDSSGPSASASRSAPDAHIRRSASARTPGAVEGPSNSF
jgi:hypothetical protein